MRTVGRLSVTAVKSMGLHHPDQIRLEPSGVPENRRFYVADEAGRLLSGSRQGHLLSIRPTYDPEHEQLTLRFPDSSLVQGDVSTLGDPVKTDFFGRPAAGRLVDGPWSRALSAHVGFTVNLVRPDLPGDANDSKPVSIFSTASAEELERRAGRRKPLDRRRFRMLVEVVGCSPHEEDGWVDGEVRMGDAVVRVIRLVPRCRVTTLDPDTGLKDFDTLKAIATYRRHEGGEDLPFGVYAEVVQPGTVAVGDPVEPR